MKPNHFSSQRAYSLSRTHWLRFFVLPLFLLLLFGTLLSGCGKAAQPTTPEDELSTIYASLSAEDMFLLTADMLSEKDLTKRCMALQDLLPDNGAVYLVTEQSDHLANAADAAGYSLKYETDTFRVYTCDCDATVYLIRHGQTVANVSGVLVGGGSDSPLTETGEENAHLLGQKLSEIPFKNAYVSELGRTKRTAKLVLSENNSWSDAKPLLVHAGLNDIGLGELEGMTHPDAVAKYGDFSLDDIFGAYDDPDFTAPHQAESKADYVKRFHDELISLVTAEKNQNANLLVTTHNAAGFWISALFDRDEDTVIDNTSVTVLHFLHGKWILEDENDTDYSVPLSSSYEKD